MEPKFCVTIVPSIPENEESDIIIEKLSKVCDDNIDKFLCNLNGNIILYVGDRVECRLAREAILRCLNSPEALKFIRNSISTL